MNRGQQSQRCLSAIKSVDDLVTDRELFDRCISWLEASDMKTPWPSIAVSSFLTHDGRTIDRDRSRRFFSWLFANCTTDSSERMRAVITKNGLLKYRRGI